ncbi:MAG: hypothetical protein IJU02_07215 [Lachnospiraceae bacterium]|nr:hypothetical protein [Lachnospiraceae bacterium]
MDDSKVFMFPDGNKSSIDPALLMALNNNGGFGNGNWIWVLFLWMMWGANGWGNGGFGGNNGTGFLANQMNNDAGRDLLLQAINGRADALGQLAQITNTGVETVKSGIFNLQSAIQAVGTQVGMSGLQVQNAIASGNAAISRQLCECCCENRLAIANQTSALQSSLAAHDASVRLQLAQNEAADQLSVCQQTNQLGSQADRNTNNIINAISAQNTLITKEFCDLKERELQNKIDTQGDIITQLRNQISNDKQTLQFNAAFHALDDKIDAIAAKQPNTVPVQWPNLVAANATPYIGGYNWNSNYWGNGFGNNVVF